MLRVPVYVACQKGKAAVETGACVPHDGRAHDIRPLREIDAGRSLADGMWGLEPSELERQSAAGPAQTAVSQRSDCCA